MVKLFSDVGYVILTTSSVRLFLSRMGGCQVESSIVSLGVAETTPLINFTPSVFGIEVRNGVNNPAQFWEMRTA